MTPTKQETPNQQETTMTIETIPLTQLVPSASNVRKTGTKDGIEALAASIAAHGLLQNLSVRPAEGGQFEVVAGGRRLAALKLLAREKKIAADYPVPCRALDGADATEISLAENEMRLPMHPADQFDAFKMLADAGKGPEEIAARFGTTAKIVAQRLKLAVVSPKLIALYRKDEMTLDCLMAFTVCDQHKTQEKVWAALPDWARERPDHIKDALTEKHVAADGKLAQFVGLPAYEAAGGAVLRDLFDDDNSGWLTDAALVNKLAAEKLDKIAEAVRGEGWKWVEIIPDLSWEAMKGFDRANAERTPPTAEQQREIDALTAEGDAIITEHGEEPDDEAVVERFDQMQERIAELSEGEETWPDAAKANTGAVIGIDHDGTAEVRRGLIKPEDKAAARKTDKATNAADTGGKGEAAAPCFSAALIEDLTAHRTAALQAVLADNPKVALVAVVHALALGVLYANPQTNSVVRIAARVAYLDRSAEGIEEAKARKQLAATTKAIGKRLPKDDGKLWGWLIEQDQKTLLVILAVCAGHTVDAVAKKHDPVALGYADELAAALKLDMVEYWQPSAVGYFGRVSKQQTLDAVAEAAGPGAKGSLSALKKADLANAAEKKLKGTGWLPAILRTA
jgi:ParB family transcriptional regulator, chromosome partitioning protein